ncbi:MAG: hypothetical protein K0S74_1847 [Chlamydiales bacterium]|nr:hypothetical protein [Chlamydiales bacterium]
MVLDRSLNKDSNPINQHLEVPPKPAPIESKPTAVGLHPDDVVSKIAPAVTHFVQNIDTPDGRELGRNVTHAVLEAGLIVGTASALGRTTLNLAERAGLIESQIGNIPAAAALTVDPPRPGLPRSPINHITKPGPLSSIETLKESVIADRAARRTEVPLEPFAEANLTALNEHPLNINLRLS